MANIKAFAKIKFSFAIVFGLSFNWDTIAIPTGKIMTAVAVLEIHMDKSAVATINPKMICTILVPTILIIVSAILLCRFHFSIAMAKINPPKNRKINLWP